MKLLFACILVATTFAVQAQAQDTNTFFMTNWLTNASRPAMNKVISTNVDASGYVTNVALLHPFAFTNADGALITNAVLVKLTANRFLYKSTDGALGMVRLEFLPPDMKKQIGFDPNRISNADLLDQQKEIASKYAARVMRDKAQKELLYEDIRNEVDESAVVIIGRVHQRLATGILVSADSHDPFNTYEPDPIYLNFMKNHDESRSNHFSVDGMLLLSDYPGQTALGDGDRIMTVAYPVGFYRYTTIARAESTIHRYTSSLDKAMQLKLAPQNIPAH